MPTTTTTVDPSTGREVILIDAFAYNGQYNVKATGFSGTAAPETTTNMDFAVGAEDRYINGVNIYLKNHNWGDTLNFQIVDKDGVLAGVAYPIDTPLPVLINQFGFNWNVDDTKQDQGREMYNYVARIPAGLYVRVAYRSVGLLSVDVKLNCFFHKKL